MPTAKDATGAAPPQSAPSLSLLEKGDGAPDLPELQSSEPTPSLPRARTRPLVHPLFVLCVLMHVLLFLFHFVLVVFRYHVRGNAFPVDKLVPVDLQLSSTILSRVGFIPNVFIKIYLVPLLYLTQRLALRRDLHLKQSLTALHDKSQAWLSLGATSVTLFKYRDLLYDRRSSKRGDDLKAFVTVLSTFLYLLGSLVIGIIAPDLISADIIYGNTTNFETLTSALPVVGQNISLLQDAIPIVSLLSLLEDGNDVNINGLFQNIVYDIPQFIEPKPSHANAIAFNVSCQQVPSGAQAGPYNAADGTFPIHVHDDLMDIDVTPLPRALNIRPALWRDPSISLPAPPIMLISSSTPFEAESDNGTDKGFSTGYSIPLNATLEPKTCIVSTDCNSTRSIQLLACIASTVHGSKDSFEVLTNSLPFVNPYDFGPDLSVNMTEVWTNWTLPEAATDPIVANVGRLAGLSPPSHVIQSFGVAGTNLTGNYTLTLLEENVMEAAGYFDDDDLDIESIEWLLAEALAGIFWRAAVNAGPTNNLNHTADSQDLSGPDVHYYMEIKLWQPWVGTAISAMMLILGVFLTIQPPRNRDRHEPRVYGLGPLELAWLMGRDKTEPGIAERMAMVDTPTLANLRSHGKAVEVAFIDN